ncbi:hypothetical protein [Cohnella cellulosilytica]|uniref:Flp pilus-assembly TadG-like N-terminal domain-containing protein n=1 Tax=Cohnella cellulosilytica TaxID=986710 RepID=A0ABW2F5R5_9BACL
MGRNFGIINLVSLVYFAALLLAYASYVHKEKNEIEQLKLSYAIDYAADAGAQELLNTGSLDMDYANSKAFSADPQKALDTFIDVFCFNYDMPPTEANRAIVRDYIPVATVATFDGYYMASHRPVEYDQAESNPVEQNGFGQDWQLVFGMKQPYRYLTTAARYALNMGMDYSYRLSDDGLEKYENLPPNEYGVTMTREYAMRWINNLVSNEISEEVDRMNESNYRWKNRFYVPSQLTGKNGVNSIEGPSFLVLVQGVDLTTARPIDGFSVSGAKIDMARMLIGYTRDSGKYYAFADQVPAGAEEPESVFSTMKEAAASGYSFDWKYMR